MKKLLHHYAMKTNDPFLYAMPRNIVLFGKYILLPWDITAAEPYLLLITLLVAAESPSSRYGNTLNISEFTDENDPQLIRGTQDKKVHNYQKLSNNQIVDAI